MPKYMRNTKKTTIGCLPNHRPLWYNIKDAAPIAVTPLKGTLAMKYDFSRLGENIASHRRTAGLTQELLADRLGVTSQAVSKWERQISCPDVSLLPAMADVFGVSIDELFVSLAPDPESPIDCLPWEDDGRVRIAVFEGKHLCSKEVYECPDGEEMVLLIRHEDGRHTLPFGTARPQEPKKNHL